MYCSEETKQPQMPPNSCGLCAELRCRPLPKSNCDFCGAGHPYLAGQGLIYVIRCSRGHRVYPELPRIYGYEIKKTSILREEIRNFRMCVLGTED
jgi:hypothetical protein